MQHITCANIYEIEAYSRAIFMEACSSCYDFLQVLLLGFFFSWTSKYSSTVSCVRVNSKRIIQLVMHNNYQDIELHQV